MLGFRGPYDQEIICLPRLVIEYPYSKEKIKLYIHIYFGRRQLLKVRKNDFWLYGLQNKWSQ